MSAPADNQAAPGANHELDNLVREANRTYGDLGNLGPRKRNPPVDPMAPAAALPPPVKVPKMAAAARGASAARKASVKRAGSAGAAKKAVAKKSGGGVKKAAVKKAGGGVKKAKGGVAKKVGGKGVTPRKAAGVHDLQKCLA